MSVIQIVSAVNDYPQYEHCIKNNPFYKNFDLINFDNTKENIPIPIRYNYFINNSLHPDAWVMFCHQDFFVNEDLNRKLYNLDKSCIYGPVGIKSNQCLGVTLRLKGACDFALRKNKFFENSLVGQISQAFNEDKSKVRFMGKRVSKPREVDTLDCCCLIVHAGLIREYGLRFDEGFEFNLYVAELSMMARKCHNIKTKVLQLNCFHLSEGKASAGYFRCLLRLIRKYPDDRIALTFSGEEEINAFRYFFANKNFNNEMKNFISVKENL